MDKIVMMPFTQAENPTEASRNFLSLMKEYPPSLFIGLALLAVVAWGRVMAVWMKAAVLAASAGIGLFLSAGVSLCPLIYVVMQPVRDKKAEEIKSSTASPEKEEKE